MTTTVTCLGSITADVLVGPVSAELPYGQLARVDHVTLGAGGCALNGAGVLRRLGASARVAGRVGDDELGRFLLRTLDELGIDRHCVVTTQTAATSASVVLVAEDGERTFLHHVGAKAEVSPRDLDRSELFAGDALHVAGAMLMPGIDGQPTADAFRHAREVGMHTSLDIAWDPDGRWERVLACLPHLDLFTPNLDEARAITGLDDVAAAASWLRERGARSVVVTLGAEGCYAHTPEFRGSVAAPRVEVVDGTGAGDAFSAALVFARLDGARDWVDALRFACAAGALATTTLGGGGAGITLDRIAGLAR